MASLVDLFNPTFLMFLGVLVLVVSVLVVYFESKLREQNQKMVGMLSLVSTLANDMNMLKMGVNHLAIIQNAGTSEQPILEKSDKAELIEVSDEDDDDNEEEDDDDNEEEDDDDEMSEDPDIKVIKLDINKNDESDESDNSMINLEDNLEFIDEDGSDNLEEPTPDISDEYVEQILDLKYDDEEKEEIKDEIKMISVNLGEEHADTEVDYKKMQLPKLRTIVVEKGLASNLDASKMKKHDLLKLLEVE